MQIFKDRKPMWRFVNMAHVTSECQSKAKNAANTADTPVPNTTPNPRSGPLQMKIFI